MRFRLSIPVGTILVLASCLPPGLVARSRDASSSINSPNADVLVHEVIHNEIEAQLHDTSLWCYRENRQEDDKPAKTFDVCQTKDGDLERLIALNGRALSGSQRRAEDQRIQELVGRPEQLRAKQKKEREDGEQQRNLLKIFPEAFLFDYTGESGGVVTLRFHPNPAFRPSTRAAMVFHHLEGTMLVDARQKRLLEINGRLTSEVKFAGGLLGHLDKNGTFVVKQQEVGEGHWDLRYLSVQMNGKALFFKTINVLEKKSLLDYRPLPRGASLQQAADFLTRDFEIHSASSAGK